MGAAPLEDAAKSKEVAAEYSGQGALTMTQEQVCVAQEVSPDQIILTSDSQQGTGTSGKQPELLALKKSKSGGSAASGKSTTSPGEAQDGFTGVVQFEGEKRDSSVQK